ncbi:mRNA-decapping enzyme subunit 2 [Tilletia horrida]|nr:mRNA-decapping enzyme subunit 2 [Tilletia horrida]
MGGAPGPPSIPPSLLLDPHLPPYSTLSFAAHLQDLACRFIVNLPADELSSIERICFQVEQAHWFYEDFLRPLNPTLPSFNLRKFSTHLLSTSAQIVPFIKQYVTSSSGGSAGELEMNLEKAFDDFLKYKTRVPVCGVIILDEKWEKVGIQAPGAYTALLCLLVKGWKSSSAWGFPKGKINQSESTRDCAVREVYEETGFDCNDILPSDSTDFLELTMREQKIRLYIVPGVSEDTHFETLTRKEISKIAWFRLRDLPAWKHNSGEATGNGKFYSVAPFAARLKTWISQNRKTHARRPKVKQGTIDMAEAAQAVEADQDEAEAVQAEQTRQLLDRLFAPVPSAVEGTSDPANADGKAELPTGSALLDHLFGRASSDSAPSATSDAGPVALPVDVKASEQALLNVLFGEQKGSQPSAPARAQSPAAVPNGGQALLDMLLAPRRPSAASPPLPSPSTAGPASSAHALLNSLFAAAASGPARFPPYPLAPFQPMMANPHHFPFGLHPPPPPHFMGGMVSAPPPPPPPIPALAPFPGSAPPPAPGASIPLSFFLGGPSASGNRGPASGGPPHPPLPPPLPASGPAHAPRPIPPPPPPPSVRTATIPHIPVPLPPAPLPPSPASSRPGPAGTAQTSLLLNILKPQAQSPKPAPSFATSQPSPPASHANGPGPTPHQANLLSTLLGGAALPPPLRSPLSPPVPAAPTPAVAPSASTASSVPRSAHQASLLNALLGKPTAPEAAPQPSTPAAAPDVTSLPNGSSSSSTTHSSNSLKALLGL